MPPTSVFVPGSSGTYIPAAGDALFLHPTAWPSTGGATAANVGDAVRVMNMPDGVNPYVGTTVELPDWWDTFDVDLYWTNSGANAGDVRWRLDRRDVADGGSLTTAFTTGASNYLTAPSQNVLAIDTIESGLTVTDSRLLALKLWRIGGDASDTLANDAGFVGLMLRRAS